MLTLLYEVLIDNLLQDLHILCAVQFLKPDGDPHSHVGQSYADDLVLPCWGAVYRVLSLWCMLLLRWQ
jgi:hypothetical protein